MARFTEEHDIPRALPSSSSPWLMILFLLAGMVAIYLFLLRAPLLGPPLPKNAYLHYVKPLKPEPTPASTTVLPPRNEHAASSATQTVHPRETGTTPPRPAAPEPRTAAPPASASHD